ncbi:MAG TPA: lipoprotein insertase outer membrane protein LolB [Luteimonas sp.]|nr:lipoprotein insertase outer membrane protein LolB [Luteimonas sp.]
MSLRILAMAACAVLLTACVAQPVRPALPTIAGTPEAHQATREARLSSAGDWNLQGRVALSNGRNGGSGRIDWRQNGDHFEVALSAPVTRQSWRLTGDTASARLEGLAGGPREGADATQLLQEATGWEIPVAALSAWVRGAHADEAIGPARMQFAADGRLSRIEQGGWTIDYSDWAAQPGLDIELPNRLNAVRGDAKVRLIVDAWSEGAVQP